MRVLIVGDSFAADWSRKYPSKKGWPNLLAERYQTINLAQAGCSEYRIYQQLVSTDLNNYDLIIVSHTSPYRIYTEHNPLRNQDLLHHHCDLIYSDIGALAKHHSDYADVKVYFEKFFSLEYAEFCYVMTREKINKLLENRRTIQIAHVELPGTVDLDFSHEFKSNPGIINHYNNVGNNNVFHALLKKEEEL